MFSAVNFKETSLHNVSWLFLAFQLQIEIDSFAGKRPNCKPPGKLTSEKLPLLLTLFCSVLGGPSEMRMIRFLSGSLGFGGN